MKRILLIVYLFLFAGLRSSAQIDLEDLNLEKIFGLAMNVEKGFAPKFSLGNTPIQKIQKVAEILGLKKNDEVNRLFNTFKTGRTIYRIAAFGGSAIAAYGIIKAIDKSAVQQDYKGALISGLSTIGTGLLIKFLTKGASYKAVDIFNGIIKKKIRNIFGIAPASTNLGMGLYVKL